jgi:hypothetical protein
MECNTGIAVMRATLMSRDYDEDNDLDDSIDVRHRVYFTDDRRHSGPGVVAFGMAIAAAIGTGIATVLAIIVMEAPQPVADDDPLLVLAGLLFLACGVTGFAGLALGFAGTFQSDRKPLYAILGLSLNGVVLFGMVVLICLGILNEA